MTTDTDAMTDRADEGKHTPLPCLYHADARILGTTWDNNWPKRFQARCECGARGPFAETQEAAVEAWNRRAPSLEATNALLAEKVARLEGVLSDLLDASLDCYSTGRISAEAFLAARNELRRTALNASREGAQ